MLAFFISIWLAGAGFIHLTVLPNVRQKPLLGFLDFPCENLLIVKIKGLFSKAS